MVETSAPAAPGRILFQLTGSIACFKACMAISKLVQTGYQVQAVATPAALNFIGEATLEGLTGRRVFSDVFATGHAMDHIHWARWADLSIICPASAGAINRLAAGIADDVVGTLFLARDLNHQRPSCWVVPAMNTSMWRHPATRDAVAKLKSWGVRIIEPTSGTLACGEVGDGRLVEPDELLHLIDRHFAAAVAVVVGGGPAEAQSRRLKVLVTGGGTREPVDAVRVITNRSTGATGRAIAAAFKQAGHEVTCLFGAGSPGLDDDTPTTRFESIADLQSALEQALGSTVFDLVIHSASVGDFIVADVGTTTGQPGHGKLTSQNPLTLSLVPAPKLVDRLRAMARNDDLVVVAFKLTADGNESQAIQNLARRARPDLIVHNRLGEVDEFRHEARIYSSEGLMIREVSNKQELADTLVALTEQLCNRPE